MNKTIASVWSLAACIAVLSAGQVAAQPRDAEVSPHEALRAAAAERAAQRAEIAQERQQNLAQRKQAEVKCYRLFAVEDCLRDARNAWRQVETRLRTQEVQINDAERKERAQERLRQIAEKQSEAPAPAGGASAASAIVRSAPQGKPAATREKSPGTVVLRDREAQERASQQRARQASQAAEQSARDKESTERAAQARQRQLEAQKTSELRRARRDKEQAQSAAEGRKPAAPLPTPP